MLKVYYGIKLMATLSMDANTGSRSMIPTDELCLMCLVFLGKKPFLGATVGEEKQPGWDWGVWGGPFFLQALFSQTTTCRGFFSA